MLTVLAAEERSGIFTPVLQRHDRGAAEIFLLKKRSALKKLKKLGVKNAVLSPSVMPVAGDLAKAHSPDRSRFLWLLPRILGKKTELPLDELFISCSPAEAAEIIELCADCARLFTVISDRELPSEVFDGLYFNKGIILRRISSPGSRVGSRAMCVTDGGRPPLGVESIELGRLGRARLYGGELDALGDVGLDATAELYLLAGLTPPDGPIGEGWGSEIFCLDMEEVL